MYGRPQIYISGLGEVTGHPENPPHSINISWGDPGRRPSRGICHVERPSLSEENGQGAVYRSFTMGKPHWYLAGKHHGLHLEQKGPHTTGQPPWISWRAHNAYKCAGGELKWATIAIENDDQWEKLVEVMGNPGWARDEKFQDSLSRWENQDEMDAHIEEWTINYTQYELTDLLQKEGIAAFPTLSNRGSYGRSPSERKGLFH